MQHIHPWGRNTKVPLWVYRFSQVLGWACAPVKSWDVQGLLDALPWLLCSLSWPPGSGISKLFSQLPLTSGGGSGKLRRFGYWMWSLWCIEAGQPQQIARTRWFTLRSVLEAATHVCAYSDRYVQPLVHPESHPW